MFKPQAFGPYQLLTRLAVGGMAELFIAYEPWERAHRLVVVKRILPQFALMDDFVAMFSDECRLSSELKHANVVRVLDHGSADKTLFLAMEYVEGPDLGQLDEAARAAGDPLTPAEAAWIIAEVAQGLEFAHTLRDRHGRALNVVHRDVGPSNVMVSSVGQVRLTDFGIAHAAERAAVTRAGMFKGKGAYSSPEALSRRKIDHRADIYSAGVVLWELLAGQPLHAESDPMMILGRVSSSTLPSPSSVNPDSPPELDAVVATALAIDRAQRFQTATALSAALRDWLGGQDQAQLPLRIAERVRRYFGDELSRRNERVDRALRQLGVDPAEASRDESTLPSFRPPTPAAPNVPRITAPRLALQDIEEGATEIALLPEQELKTVLGPFPAAPERRSNPHRPAVPAGRLSVGRLPTREANPAVSVPALGGVPRSERGSGKHRPRSTGREAPALRPMQAAPVRPEAPLPPPVPTPPVSVPAARLRSVEISLEEITGERSAFSGLFEAPPQISDSLTITDPRGEPGPEVQILDLAPRSKGGEQAQPASRSALPLVLALLGALAAAAYLLLLR